ncbi:hypothetical protein ACWD4G_31880 [Streptomyces sp. NPDC002643]
MTWHQRAALRVIARTPSRLRHRTGNTPYIDTHTSTKIAITTWRALEGKRLVHRDHDAHPSSPIGQRLALTPLGLAVLNHFHRLTFPVSATRLWPPAPPAHLTTLPTAPPPARPAAPTRPPAR